MKNELVEMNNVLTIGLDTGKKIEHVIESRDLRPKNITALRNSINNVNWDALFSSVIPLNDADGDVIPQNVLVNESFNRFHSKLLELMDSYVPICTRTVREKKYRREPWLTNGISMCISKSKIFYRKSIVNDASEQDVIRYKNYRNCLNRLKRKTKTAYYQNLCTSLKKIQRNYGKL